MIPRITIKVEPDTMDRHLLQILFDDKVVAQRLVDFKDKAKLPEEELRVLLADTSDNPLHNLSEHLQGLLSDCIDDIETITQYAHINKGPIIERQTIIDAVEQSLSNTLKEYLDNETRIKEIMESFEPDDVFLEGPDDDLTGEPRYTVGNILNYILFVMKKGDSVYLYYQAEREIAFVVNDPLFSKTNKVLDDDGYEFHTTDYDVASDLDFDDKHYQEYQYHTKLDL